jgi:hypothetical protein
MEKLKELKIKWLSLMEEYGKEYPYGSDNSTDCTILLDKMRAIETTFSTLGLRVQDYKI